MFELTPRQIANDLHEDLSILLTIIHAMDCISYSNAFRGEADENLDHEAIGYLAMWGQNRVKEMERKVEKLRYAIAGDNAPDCRSCVDLVTQLEAGNE